MQFASDNTGPVHPNVLDALARANEGYAPGYGADDLTLAAVSRIRQLFEAPNAAVYFVATGTAANALLLAAMTKPWETVFCARHAHIEEDECGAPEFFIGGGKLALLDGPDAKVGAEALEARLSSSGGAVHHLQPGPVTLTQASERGTLYRLDEIHALSKIARAHGVKLHMDGARFANALVELDCTPAEMTWKAGVDAVSFGGTKNGLMGVEAAVIFDPALAWEFELRRKRAGHLFSKHRYLAAQMLAYLENGLWLDLAKRSNDAAAQLELGLRSIPALQLLHPREANMVFVRMPRAHHDRLQSAGAKYYLLDEDNETVTARLVCDWSTDPHETQRFLELLSRFEIT